MWYLVRLSFVSCYQRLPDVWTNPSHHHCLLKGKKLYTTLPLASNSIISFLREKRLDKRRKSFESVEEVGNGRRKSTSSSIWILPLCQGRREWCGAGFVVTFFSGLIPNLNWHPRFIIRSLFDSRPFPFLLVSSARRMSSPTHHH